MVSATLYNIKKLGDQLLDLVFPPACLLCDAQVLVAHSLCADCWGKMTFISDPLCSVCGVPFPVALEDENICHICLQNKPIFTMARAVVRFDDATAQLIHNFKYYDRPDYAVLMASLMSKYHDAQLYNAALITPVPMHSKRLRERQYNQAGLLAKHIARKIGVRFVPDLLIKTKHTPSQSGLTAEARKENIKDAFVMNPKFKLRNQSIILVDDVITTGATMNECARVLASNGNNQTIALAFARTY
jgi:ComF family protein